MPIPRKNMPDHLFGSGSDPTCPSAALPVETVRCARPNPPSLHHVVLRVPRHRPVKTANIRSARAAGDRPRGRLDGRPGQVITAGGEIAIAAAGQVDG